MNGARVPRGTDSTALVVVGVLAGLAGVLQDGPAVALAVGGAVELVGLWLVRDRPPLHRLVHAAASGAVAVGAPLALTGYDVTDCLWTGALAYLCIAAATRLDRSATTAMGWLTLAGATGFGVVGSTDARWWTGVLVAVGALGVLARRADATILRPVAALAVVGVVVATERTAAPVTALLAMGAMGVPVLLVAFNWSRRWWDPAPANRSIVDALADSGWPATGARRALLVPTAVGGVGAILVADDVVPAVVVAAVFVVVVVLAVVVTFETRHGRRLSRWFLGAGALVAGALVAAGSVAALSVVKDMRDASDLARRGLEAAKGGELSEALGPLDQARTRFVDAQSSLESPLGVLGKVVPGMGAGLRAAEDLAGVGIALSDDAKEAAVLLTDGGLTLDKGQLPLDDVERLAGHLTDIDTELGRALAVADRGLRSPWLRPARDQVAKARARLVDLADTTEAGRRVARFAPALFGGDGARRYLVAVVTPSELRGSGGLMGSFGELVADDGRVRMARLDRIQDLNEASDPGEQADLLGADVVSAYSPFDLTRFWQNRTAPVDFALAAQSMEEGYAAATGVEVDGTILVTPIALARMLDVTGGIRVPGWPVPVTGRNAEEILLLDQYVALDGDAREAFLAEVAAVAFDKFIGIGLPSVVELADRLGPAAAAGHLRLHFADDDEQSLAEYLGFDGALPDPRGGDALTLVTQNASSSKIDAFLRRSLSYDVVWDAGSGAVSGVATVRLENTAPAAGLPPYVLGGLGASPVSPGTNRMYVELHGPVPVVRVTVDGEEVPVTSASPGGAPMSSVLLSVPPGGTVEVRFDLEGRLASGPYRLTLGVQPVAKPDRVSVSVRDPAGGSLPFRERSDREGRVSLDLQRPLVLTTRR